MQKYVLSSRLMLSLSKGESVVSNCADQSQTSSENLPDSTLATTTILIHAEARRRGGFKTVHDSLKPLLERGRTKIDQQSDR